MCIKGVKQTENVDDYQKSFLHAKSILMRQNHTDIIVENLVQILHYSISVY